MWCCVTELLRNIRTQVLIKLIKPYTRIHIPFISKVSTHDQNNILHSQLIFYLYFFIFRQSFDLFWKPISHINLNKMAELEEDTMKITHVPVASDRFQDMVCLCRACNLRTAWWFVTQNHPGSFPSKLFVGITASSWKRCLAVDLTSRLVNHLPPSHSWQSQETSENIVSIKKSFQFHSLLFFQWNVVCSSHVTNAIAAMLAHLEAIALVFKQTVESLSGRRT